MWFFIYSTFNKITSFPWELNRYSYGVQFGINCTALDQSKLSNFVECAIIIGNKQHEWVFQKAEIARAPSTTAISAFWKTHKYKLISNWTRKTVWLLINNTNMKKCARKSTGGRCFLKAFFRIRENFFQSFHTTFLSLLYIRSLEYKISHSLSANQNSELRCVICTGVTLFALLLHLNCTALSQSEFSNYFHVYYYTWYVVGRRKNYPISSFWIRFTCVFRRGLRYKNRRWILLKRNFFNMLLLFLRRLYRNRCEILLGLRARL